MLDDRSAAQVRTDVSVLLVADGPEPGLVDAVAAVLVALDAAARGETDGSAGGRPRGGLLRGGLLRGDRLGGELVLAVRDVTALPPGLPRHDPRLRVVAVPGAGGGRARNLAAGAARGRYVLLTSPDARVPREWVVAMVEPLRTGCADLVAGTERVGGAERGAVDAPDGLPAPSDAFPAGSCGATRAVLESLGFDEALGVGRSPDAAVTAVFRADAVSAGFRARAVAGVPVDRPGARRGRRAVAAAARDRGRTDAYLDRHVRTGPSRRGRTAAVGVLVRDVLRLAGAVGTGGPGAWVGARAEVARAREAVRLASAPDRSRPRSAAGELPGGPGGARAVVAVPLVARPSVRPTVLPAPPAAVGAAVGAAAREAGAAVGDAGTAAGDTGPGPGPRPVDAPGRGVAHLLWPGARGAVSRPVLSPRAASGPR